MKLFGMVDLRSGNSWLDFGSNLDLNPDSGIFFMIHYHCQKRLSSLLLRCQKTYGQIITNVFGGVGLRTGNNWLDVWKQSGFGSRSSNF